MKTRLLVILAVLLGLGLSAWAGVNLYGARKQLNLAAKDVQAEKNRSSVLKSENRSLSDALAKANAEKAELAAKLAKCEEEQFVEYTVVKGDTLWSISRRFLGNPRLYPQIATDNQIDNPDLIYPGDVLKIKKCGCSPALPTQTKSAPAATIGQSARKTAPKAGHAAKSAPVSSPVQPVSAPPAPANANAQVQVNINQPAPVAPPAPPVAAQPPPSSPAPVAVSPQQPVATATPVKEVTGKSNFPVSRTGPTYVTTAPGNAWSTGGNLSPVEKDNLLNYSHLEQGFTLWRNGKNAIVPYVSVDTAADSEGYDWNNKAVVRAGAKYVRSFRLGIVSLGGGYAYEKRFRSDFERGEPYGFGSYWFGWDLPTKEPASRKLFSSFPGSTWGIGGNLSPAEKGNVQAQLYAQQGVTLTKLKGISLIPYVEDTLNVDTKKLVWNNRNILGAGLKLARPIGSGILELGAVYKDENRWITNQRAHGVTGYVNFWYGWNPAVGGRK
jgi:LysM repeat protein